MPLEMFVTLPGFKISPKCVCGRGRAPWTLLEELTALSRPLARLGEGRKGKEGKGKQGKGKKGKGKQGRKRTEDEMGEEGRKTGERKEEPPN